MTDRSVTTSIDVPMSACDSKRMQVSIDSACKFLESLQRRELALLLRQCTAAVEEREYDNGFIDEVRRELIVSAPYPIMDALKRLAAHDRKRIAEAICSRLPNADKFNDIVVENSGAEPTNETATLLAELLIHRQMMISVATGGERIQDVDDHYRAREARVRQAIPAAANYTNPHDGLWDWYNYYKEHLSSYRERGQYINKLFASAIEFVAIRSGQSFTPREPTGWQRVDRALADARARLDISSVEEEFQAIGLLCREVIISLAQAVYDPDIHESIDGVAPSQTDANRMLEAYIAHAFPGSSNKEVRAHARAALALALNLQHRRTATKVLAALCVEATGSTVAILHIIANAQAAP